MPAQPKINAQKYEELLLRRGRTVKWQESITCSCVNIDSGQPLYECKVCNGKGYTLSDPIEDVVLLQSVTNSREFDEMAGVFQVGDAVLTVGYYVPEVNPSTGLLNRTSKGRKNLIYSIGENDLITLTDDEYKTSEVLIKNTPIYGRPADTLLNSDIVEVRLVRKSDPVTGDITLYTKDVDFTLNGAQVVWQGVNQPNDGEQYTVQYTHRPVFTVFTSLPTPRFQDGQDLPRKVALRYRAGGLDKR
jgi:hypothetical protein